MVDLDKGIKDQCKLWGYDVPPRLFFFKVGFIREKGRATAGACNGAWKQVAPCSGEGWGFMDVLTLGLGKG
jgi:hypothetical protein